MDEVLWLPPSKEAPSTMYLDASGMQRLMKEGTVKIIIYAVLLLTISTTIQAKLYRWVDENGTTHFSDQPRSEKAQEIYVEPHDVTYHGPLNNKQQTQTKSVTTKTIYINKTQKSPQKKIITEDDYRISNTTVGKLGNNVMFLSGRVGDGPVCKNMQINAHAKNENGLSFSITENTRLSSSGGSTTFDGKKKVYGSAEDRGFWDVSNVSVRCLD